jgi:hypothetical protein
LGLLAGNFTQYFQVNFLPYWKIIDIFWIHTKRQVVGPDFSCLAGKAVSSFLLLALSKKIPVYWTLPFGLLRLGLLLDGFISFLMVLYRSL